MGVYSDTNYLPSTGNAVGGIHVENGQLYYVNKNGGITHTNTSVAVSDAIGGLVVDLSSFSQGSVFYVNKSGVIVQINAVSLGSVTDAVGGLSVANNQLFYVNKNGGISSSSTSYPTSAGIANGGLAFYENDKYNLYYINSNGGISYINSSSYNSVGNVYH